MRLLTVVKALVFVLAALACLMYLPIAATMVAWVGLLALYILMDAYSHRILFKMARRNFVRRKGTTALVVAGLMVGTAIIATSFVVGDTLNNMIGGEITKGAGNVNFVVASPDEQGGFFYFNDSELTSVSDQILALDHVQAVSWVTVDSFGVMNSDTGLSSSSFTVMGTNGSLMAGFGGWTDENGDIVSSGPSATGCYMYSASAKDLGAGVGDVVVFQRGAGQLVLSIEKIVENHEAGDGNLTTNAFVDIATMRTYLGEQDRSNVLLIRTDSTIDDRYAYDAQVQSGIATVLSEAQNDDGLQIVVNVKENLDTGRENASLFTQLFFVFGAFSVIAGIVLVVNIFTMLGEERKTEMGMARALGMRKVDLERLFTYEGLLYAAAAALVGTLVGVGLAYVMVIGVSGMFQFGDTAMIDYFTFLPLSLTIAFLAGFLLTIITVYSTTRRISNLNIVRAVKDVPEPPVSRNDKRAFRLGVIGLLGGLLLMVVGITTESLGPAVSGLSLMTLSLGLLLRRFVSDRLAWNVAGWVTLFLWLPKPGNFQIFNYEMGIELFVISGLFMVTSALIIVIFNSDAIVNFITRVFRVKNGYKAVIKTAVSYPLRAKFRTGLSIFIFGLVIFTVTTMSMMSGILAVGIPKMVEESSGGFDVVAFRTVPVPFQEDPWETINSTQGYIQPQNVTNMVTLSSMPARADYSNIDPATSNVTYYSRDTSVLGFDERLFTTGSFPLKDWNTTLYATEEEVWNAVLSDPTLVILDGGWQASVQNPFMSMGETGRVEVGQTIMVTSYYGQMENLTVVGIMKQTFFNGIFMSKSHAAVSYAAVGTGVMMIEFAEGLDVQEQAALLEREFLQYGLVTINVDEIAKQITNMINNIFTLIQAFLSIGLVIGIVGLGIITIRSIHERKLEIGMMRAIGYKKRMVVANFAIESAFISALGILVGSILGIAVGYDLYQTAFSSGDYQFDFVINWVPIVLIGAGAFIATLLSVYPASRGASRISPAEVLRFE